MKWLIIVFLSTVISCGSPNHDNLFENQVELTGIPILTNDSVVHKMLVADSFLLVVNYTPMGEDKGMVNIYRKDKLDSPVTSIIRLGRGPNEFLSPFLTGEYSGNQDNPWFGVTDISTSRYYMIDLKRSIENGSTYVINSFNYPQGAMECFNIGASEMLISYSEPVDKSIKTDIINDGSSQNMYSLFNGILDNMSEMRVLGGSFRLRPDNQKLVIAFSCIDTIQILDINKSIKGSTIMTSDNLRKDITRLKGVEQTDLVRYYSDIAATDKYIYAIYFNQTWADILKEGEQRQSTFLHILDWNGKKLWNIKLDQNIQTLTVDESENIVYGATNYNTAYKYMLPF